MSEKDTNNKGGFIGRSLSVIWGVECYCLCWLVEYANMLSKSILGFRARLSTKDCTNVATCTLYRKKGEEVKLCL